MKAVITTNMKIQGPSATNECNMNSKLEAILDVWYGKASCACNYVAGWHPFAIERGHLAYIRLQCKRGST